MRIVLLEAPYANQTAQGTRDLISVKHAEIGVADRQFAVTMNAVFVHERVSGTVHGL